MTWVRIDDLYPEDLDTVTIGEDAAWVNIVAICYCARNLTDGVVPKAILPRLTHKRKIQGITAKLVGIGWWVDEGSNFRIVKYLDHQRSREDVILNRGAARGRQSRHRSQKSNGVTTTLVTGLSQRQDTEGDTDTEVLGTENPQHPQESTAGGGVENLAPLQIKTTLLREGFDPNDVDDTVKQFTERVGGRPITDPVAWGRGRCTRLQVRREADELADSRRQAVLDCPRCDRDGMLLDSSGSYVVTPAVRCNHEAAS